MMFACGKMMWASPNGDGFAERCVPRGTMMANITSLRHAVEHIIMSVANTSFLHRQIKKEDKENLVLLESNIKLIVEEPSNHAIGVYIIKA